MAAGRNGYDANGAAADETIVNEDRVACRSYNLNEALSRCEGDV